MSRRHNRFDKYREKFYRVPKVFMTNATYKKLSNDAKIAYAILQDRQELSIKNGWYDKKGDIYFIYSNPKLVEILSLSINTVTKVKKELLKADLLEEQRTGRATRYYLLKPEVTEADIYKIDEAENATGDQPEDVEQKQSGTDGVQAIHKSCESDPTKPVKQNHKICESDSQNLCTNDTDLKDIEFRDTDINKSSSSSVVDKTNTVTKTKKANREEEDQKIKEMIQASNNVFSELLFFCDERKFCNTQRQFMDMVKRLASKKIFVFTYDEMNRAYEKTVDRVESGIVDQPHLYYPTVLENEIQNSKLAKQRRLEKIEEYHQAIQLSHEIVFYNWLEN